VTIDGRITGGGVNMRDPVEETSFEVTEIRGEEYGFTLKHPVGWTNMTETQLCKAIALNQTLGLFVWLGLRQGGQVLRGAFCHAARWTGRTP